MPETLAASARPTLGFALAGLSGREETLFKAFVRLLDHRTLQHWVHQPDRPDLCIVAENAALPESLAAFVVDTARAVAPMRLTLCSTPSANVDCIGLPLRVDALEAALNRLGLARLRDCSARLAAEPDLSVQLLRWPPAEFLGTSQRVRLATLMLGKPVTASWLQQRAGVSQMDCATFLSELRGAGVLTNSRASNPVHADAALSVQRSGPAPVAALPTLGLLARIRLRLGLRTD